MHGACQPNHRSTSMNAAQQTQPSYDFLVPEDVARENVRRGEERKAQARANKDALRKYAEALRQDRARDKERSAAEAVRSWGSEVPFLAFVNHDVPAPKLRVVHTPTPEEVEALRAETARREEARLRAVRRAAAEKTKVHLLRWAEKTKPAISLFIEEVLAALFVHVRDERNAAVYACEGVEIRAFGAAVEVAPRNTKRVSRLSDEQQRAASRRSHNKATLNASWAEAVKIMTTEVAKPARTAEERADAKAKNVANAAALKAAKDAKQAAFKLAHPKAKKAPVVKAKDKGEEKKKGGK